MFYCIALILLLIIIETFFPVFNKKIGNFISDKIKIILIIIFASIVIFIIYGINRVNTWCDKLSMPTSNCAIANVFDEQTIDISTYHDYIYKVGNIYYTCDVTGSNVNISSNTPINSFLVVYDSEDPTIHTVIFSYKFSTPKSLDDKIDCPINKIKLVKKHTKEVWLSPRANINNRKKIDNYLNKIKKL